MAFAVVLAALSLAATQTDAARQRATELVARLGAADYRDREEAARELLAMGAAAQPAVLAGRRSPDPEVSERCRRLYPVLWRRDLERRVRRFVARPDGPVPDDLPGAARWVEAVGDGKESRELYAELMRAHPEAVARADREPGRVDEAYSEFVQKVYARLRARRPPGVPARSTTPRDPEVLLFLFLGTVGDVRRARIPGVSSSAYYQFLNAPYTVARLGDRSAVAFHKLYAAWLGKERYSLVVRRAIDLAAQHGVRECVPAALRIAREERTATYIRATTLLAVARMGAREHIAALAPFLEDETRITMVTVKGVRGSVLVRDVALGAAVTLAGQDLADFGFEHRRGTALSYTYYAFATDEKRAAAHARWQEWAAANLKE